MWVYVIKVLCPRPKWRNLGKVRLNESPGIPAPAVSPALRRREVILKERVQKVLERNGWLVLAGLGGSASGE